MLDQQVLQYHFPPPSTDLILEPVVASKHMTLMLPSRAGRRTAFLLPDFHPAGLQRRIPCQGHSVDKDELEIISENPYQGSHNSSALALA
jgi:hypothetical protein